MIGYGCFAIVIVLLIKRKQKYVKSTIAMQLPLIIAIASFATMFVTYANQELGNLSISYISKVDGGNLTVNSNEKYSTNQEKLVVYKTKQYSQDEIHQIAEKFFGSFRDTIDESRTDLYDATEEVIRLALEQYGIELPDDMDFSNDADGNYNFTANEIIKNGIMYDGAFVCQYYENGKMGSVNGDIIQCEYYKEFNIISEIDAYKVIEEGRFNTYLNSDELNIKTGQVSLQYMTDTKGYYQPIYVFEAEINGKRGEISIPAIE
jgi:hypothetical protein